MPGIFSTWTASSVPGCSAQYLTQLPPSPLLPGRRPRYTADSGEVFSVRLRPGRCARLSQYGWAGLNELMNSGGRISDFNTRPLPAQRRLMGWRHGAPAAATIAGFCLLGGFGRLVPRCRWHLAADRQLRRPLFARRRLPPTISSAGAMFMVGGRCTPRQYLAAQSWTALTPYRQQCCGGVQPPCVGGWRGAGRC